MRTLKEGVPEADERLMIVVIAVTGVSVEKEYSRTLSIPSSRYVEKFVIAVTGCRGEKILSDAFDLEFRVRRICSWHVEIIQGLRENLRRYSSEYVRIFSTSICPKNPL